MADKAEFDSRPNHFSKDGQESNNPIPLSPQWRFPKPGENKAGIATGENHLNPHSVYASRSDLLRSPGMVEDGHDHQKKKDVFRPSVMDMDPARRWREEERDINSSFRRDRWREEDKELGDNRKVDRWTDSSGRHYGETRRPTTERWTDSGNRESNHDQRRESKWNTRWGPGDKEADGGREKWSDFSKDADMPIEKGSYKDEKDMDNYRPWRSNLSQSRGRAEPPHHQAWTPNKPVSSFNHGRGRGESAPPTFHLGRGRIPSGVSSGNNIPTHFQSHGMLSEKDGIVPTSLMEQEPLEPLAFCAPSPEESVILNGIDKGDVVCSGVPQLTKDGSVGRNSSELLQSRSKLGSRDELQLSLNDSRDEISGKTGGGYLNHSETFTNEKPIDSYGYNYKFENTHDYEIFSNPKLNAEASREGSFHRENESLLVDKESTMQRHSPALHGGMWRSSSFGEHSHMASKESREMPLGARSKISDVDWSQTQKDLNNEWERSLADSSYSQNNGPKSHFGDSSMLKSKHFAVLDKDLDMRKLSQPSPEDLVLYYKDPRGEIQGPFSGSDIIGWFEAGYFGIELLVRLAGAPPDTPFSQLEDVMPHLRAKARAPPGFGTPKPNTDASNGLNMNSFTQLHSGSAQIDVLKNEQRYKHSSSTEAENKFIESLMFNMSNGPPQSDGFIGNNAGPVPSLGDESGGSMYLLAKKMALERQRSLPNPYSYWQGKDAASIVPTPDVVQDSLLHPKQSLIGDSARQQSHIQNVDLMSVLQGLPDRSAGMNSGTSSWSNFPAQGGLENIQNRLDMHHGLNFSPQPAFGIQQQRLLAQNTSIKNLLVPTLDNPPNISTSEKMISSGISHDPQMLSLLQKQYLLQLQSQAPPMSQQLSVLDKLLLLEQQQKQEQQQQLMLQQQQLLTQVLAEHHPSKQFGEQLYGQSQTADMPSGITTLDHARFPSSGELSCMGSQAQVAANEQTSQFVLPISQAVSNTVGSEPSSTHLPHQIYGDIIGQRSWGTNLQDQFNSVQQKGSFLETGVIDPPPVADVASKYPLEQTSEIEPPAVTSESTPSFPPVEELETFVDLSVPSSGENDLSLNSQSDSVKPPPETHEEPQAEGGQHSDELCSVKEVKNVELHEVKKSSEKKSKRQKSAKMQASDTTRGVSKTQQLKSEGTSVTHVKADNSADSSAIVKDSAREKMENKNVEVASDASNVQPEQSPLPAHVTREVQNIETKDHSGQVGAVSNIDTENVSGLRAWKPAPGFKPMSLLEIQEEEQRRAQAEMAVTDITTSLNSISVSTPWAGVAGNSDPKLLNKIQQDAGNSLNKSDSLSKQKGKKSQLHDLLEGSTGVKSNEREQITDITPSVPAAPISNSQADLDNDNFIEAKETKKSRKKSAKAKGSGTKSSVSIASVETSVSSPIDKVKSSRQLQPEKEVLPAVPSGPSLGDFVVWKGEPANPSPPVPAWSTESGKVPKPTLLRDILKEQERKASSGQQHIPVPTPQKSMPKQPTRGGGSPSWSVTDSSPPKAASPMQINSRVASKTKNQIEDDFFWGPVDQSKQEPKQSDFPHLGTQGSWGNRNTPVKGTPGGSLSRQKSIGRPMEHTLSSSPATSSSLKGKKEALTKQSEAMDFREWCESECLRLLGTKDTSFLQFCLNQTRSEAEVLLTENLGSFDPDHEFIHKFLDYKELLPADVLEIALQSGGSNQKATGRSAADSTSDGAAFDVATKGGGRKKGKKGKKVSLSELGFNVVSNRIMMGEIQTLED